MNDYGKPRNETAQQDEQAPEPLEQLNLLDAIDRLITPEHVAKRFRELLEDVRDEDPPAPAALGEDRLTRYIDVTLSEAEAQAAEIVACARREADTWLVRAQRAASEADAASQKAQTILANADALADAELQRAASMIADARRQSNKGTKHIPASTLAVAGRNGPATCDAPQQQAAVMTVERSSAYQFSDEEPTRAAELTISLLPDRPAGTEDKAIGIGQGRHFITIFGMFGDAFKGRGGGDQPPP